MNAKTLARTIPIMAAGVVALWLFADTIAEFFKTWISDGNYAHGIIVAPVAAGLIYARRAKLESLAVRPSLKGNLLLACGLVMFLLSRWADVSFVQGLSLVMVTAGLVWTFFGSAVLRELAFPIGFLIFMSPAPDFFVEKVGAPLQRASCSYATMLGGLFGVSVHSSGVTFVTNGMTFAVDVPCSGIRAINAMAAFTAVLAYLTHAPISRRFLIFLLALPIAFAGNVLRVFGVLLVASSGAAKTEVMRIHDLSGPIVFLMAVGLVLLIKRRFECSLRNDICPVL